jgi:hypothetical protein
MLLGQIKDFWTLLLAPLLGLPLPPLDLAVCLGLSSLTLLAVEIEKALMRPGLLYRSAERWARVPRS